jgi:hypothetical protein
LRDACRNAFSPKSFWHVGVLDDNFVSMLTVGNNSRITGTGSQFKALLDWKAERVVKSVLLMAKPQWLGRNEVKSKWMVWWDMGEGWISWVGSGRGMVFGKLCIHLFK